MGTAGSQRETPAGSVIWPSRSKPDFNLECTPEKGKGEEGVKDGHGWGRWEVIVEWISAMIIVVLY